MTLCGRQSLEISYREYTEMDIAEALHPYELHPRPYNVLNVNYLMAPVGNESCGPMPLEKYVLHPQEWDFSIIINFDAENEA